MLGEQAQQETREAEEHGSDQVAHELVSATADSGGRAFHLALVFCLVVPQLVWLWVIWHYGTRILS